MLSAKLTIVLKGGYKEVYKFKLDTTYDYTFIKNLLKEELGNDIILCLNNIDVYINMIDVSIAKIELIERR